MAIVQDIFKGNEQQDAQEFLVNCLDTINEEVSSIDDIDEPIINPVTQNITGEEFFSFKCVQCGHESTKTQEFTDLSIHIDQNTDQDDSDEETVIDARTLPEPVVDIQQLLNRMFQQEEIISRYCEACGHSLARSKREICVLPEVLILHLARFEAKETNSSGYVKKTERIGINETIRTLNARDVYEIAAVIGHEGSTPRQGHYYTAVRSYEKKMWLDCDDEEINEISKQNALSSAERQSTCYLLFYRKLEKQIE
jgi:ubiquitin C-terminal hydrolase